MKITGNGIAFNYHIDGPTDAPWVTFTTGISNNISMWDAHIDVLARSYQLLRYDSRGHGESEATDGDYDFGLLVGDTVGLWDALGIDRSYLVGIGLGAMSAIELALAHAGRLRGLVACACRAELTPDYEGIWPPMIETAKNEGIEGIVERTSQRWFPDSFRENNPDVLERVRAMIRTTSLDGYLGLHRGASDPRYRSTGRRHRRADPVHLGRAGSPGRPARDHAVDVRRCGQCAACDAGRCRSHLQHRKSRSLHAGAFGVSRRRC